MNPILSREVRVRWRDGRAFGLVFAVSAALSLLFAWIYGLESSSATLRAASPNVKWALIGHNLFSQLAWIQTLAWLLISPTLTSSSISYERERGWFDALLLSPLLPYQIALSKWATALLYAATVYVVTLPFFVLTLLLGGVSPGEFWLVLTLNLLCASCGSAIGLAASSWSYRSHVALRTTYGLILMWLLGSLGGAAASGAMPFRFPTLGMASNAFWEWFGRTNPVLCAASITSSGPIPSWPTCFLFMGGLTGFFLWVATYFSRRPLEEAPFIERKRRVKKNSQPLQSHGEIPFVSRLKFHNPVLDREVRSKFRMRQPPIAAIVVECLLALLVGYFYLRTLYWAFTVPSMRITIWWGLIFTGLIVTIMASAVMGGNGFSRERESGTWEGIRLSLLRPDEILRGKVFSSLITCAIFSLPVWPLLLPCIAWGGSKGASLRSLIFPQQALSCLIIWAATIWSCTFIGLWVGHKATRSSRAAGQTLGLLALFFIGAPIISYIGLDTEFAGSIMGLTHPLVAMGMVMARGSSMSALESFLATGIPFVLVQLLFGGALWRALKGALAQEMAEEQSLDYSSSG